MALLNAGPKGHRGIRAGSRKEKVAQAYDKNGAEAALKVADSEGIKEMTARSWISAWKRESGEVKVAASADGSKPSKKADGNGKTAAKSETKAAAPKAKAPVKVAPKAKAPASKAKAKGSAGKSASA